MMTSHFNMNLLIDNVLRWGEDKGITGVNGSGTLLGQLKKTQEELDETIDAATRYTFADHSDEETYAMIDLIDGIGDTMVTLILAAEIAGLSIEKCLKTAYDVIKDRTGKMDGGQFVKDSK